MTVTTAHRNEQGPSIARDSEILAKRIAAVQRLAFLRKLLASPYERAA